MLRISAFCVLSCAASLGSAQGLTDLPALPLERLEGDWLLERPARGAGVYQTEEGRSLVLDNGLVRRTWRVEPALSCVALEDLSGGTNLLRAVRPEARVTLNGRTFDVGGLRGQPNHAYLTEEWLAQMEADPAALQLVGWERLAPAAPFKWERRRHAAPGVVWPPQGAALRFDFGSSEIPGVTVSIHYELYDGVPLFCKWLSVRNESARPLMVDSFSCELLAVVEHSSYVETRPGVVQPPPGSLHVETEFAFGGMTPDNANAHAVHWRPDPEYTTQVNYLLQTPCLLEVAPTYGPAQLVAPGKHFEGFRTFELLHDSSVRERRSLALRRMYRTIAPWVTENPLMMHMRSADPAAVRAAIEQCAAVGFEVLILSFGSGFDIEDESPENLERWRELADYAHARGVEIGGYSLLSSRWIGEPHNIVSPEGSAPVHGNCPALTSEWGLEYYRKLRQFFEVTGFDLLEHDGPYPGDVDVTPRPPLQRGELDSRWVQWRIASGFYRWCRERGIYINAPDYYLLAGTNKIGMGYREVNWSLPRAQQVIHTRQNIYDGTWGKTPSMGWMFVPLTEYQGGGAAATIEPLDEHLEHYDRMLSSNLALGVQACYRGPRLFDTERTRELVRSRVEWFKEHRAILESDLIHGRRADGRDLDWMLHVNPELEERGMLVVFNPLDREISRTLEVPLYYTGLEQAVLVSREGGAPERLVLARDYSAEVEVRVPAGGMSWYVLSAPPEER
jgi:hypothetical protein